MSVLVLFFALLTTSWLWLPAALRLMANNDFFVTSAEEGTAKAIMHFGKFVRFVVSWERHYFSENWQVMDGESDKKHWIDKFLPDGLFWVGYPWINKVYRYHFQWTSIRQGATGESVPTIQGVMSIVEQDKLKDVLVSRDERPDYIYLKRDVYGITFQNIDDADMIPLSFIALFTAQVINPYKALFLTEQWLEQITNFLRRYIKEYVGRNTFRQLVIDKDSDDANGESEKLLGYLAPLDRSDAGGKRPTVSEYIEKEWGIKIYHLNLVNFVTAGKLGIAYEEAAATKYTREQEAEGIVELANAENKRQRIVAKGEAKRIQTVTAALEAGGEIAMNLRKLEALEKVGEGGNMVVMNGDSANILLSPLKKEERRIVQ